MKLYRFSPIKAKNELLEAIKHTHFMCHELCLRVLGRYPSISGNIGIFCHYDEEYEFLSKLKEELTDSSDNWNQKYYRLHNPIVVEPQRDIPETTYTYLYIRKPDQYRAQVGDVDFVVTEEEYNKLKEILPTGTRISSAKVFGRPDLNMIELSHPDIDALAYLTTKGMPKSNV